MFRKYLLPVLSVAGFFLALWMVSRSAKPIPASKPIAEPPRPPHEYRISGSGIVEASTQNIAIGTPVSGVVAKVFVQVSQRVEAGDPIFELDDRREQATLAVKEKALAEARARLNRLLEAPRKEELPPARERVKEAEANLEDLRFQLQAAENVTDRRAISLEDLNRRRFAVQAAEARLASAQANLRLLEAGSWKADVEVAKTEVAKAEADVHAARVEIDRLHVSAPVTGNILQVNIRPGEFAQSGVLPEPLILMGDLERLHVRVDIDENDAWRFLPTGTAVAFIRGNPQLKVDLTFEYVEPYVVPKRSLTGDSTERVDTRVMQILYSFPRSALNVYPGQLMDVYIEDKTARPSEMSVPVSPGGNP
jgi:HlyD family secretion protein